MSPIESQQMMLGKMMDMQKIAGPDDGEAEVLVGSMRMKQALDDLQAIARAYRSVCVVRWQAIQMPQKHYFVLGYENSAPVRVCCRD